MTYRGTEEDVGLLESVSEVCEVVHGVKSSLFEGGGRAHALLLSTSVDVDRNTLEGQLLSVEGVDGRRLDNVREKLSAGRKLRARYGKTYDKNGILHL